MMLASSINGNGKSFGVAYAATALEEMSESDLEFFERRRTLGTLYWLNAVQLGTMTKSEARDCVRRASRSWLCILDDLGAEQKWAVDYSKEILTVRHTERLETLATTNLAEAEGEREGLPTDYFFERYGDRITNRIAEDGAGANGKARSWIYCPEESLRGEVRPSVRVVQETPLEPEVELSGEEMNAWAAQALAGISSPAARPQQPVSDAELGTELLAMLRVSDRASSKRLLREAEQRVRGRWRN
jgi:hypothetical protein